VDTVTLSVPRGAGHSVNPRSVTHLPKLWDNSHSLFLKYVIKALMVSSERQSGSTSKYPRFERAIGPLSWQSGQTPI